MKLEALHSLLFTFCFLICLSCQVTSAESIANIEYPKIIIEDDILYAHYPYTFLTAGDYLGLVSDKDIEIAPPDITGPGDLLINASIYARRRFIVKHYSVKQNAMLFIYGSLTAGSMSADEHLPLPDEPSIAVLPFINMSGDPEQEYFADGLVEDIITTLSKLAGLRVIARHSSFVYKGQTIDIREVARHLGVHYVLEGSVRKGGNRIRITAQLIDADSGSHVWAERYDRAMDDIFAVQDEITLVLATEMQVKLTEGEQARLHYTTTGNVEAWTQWVKGLSHYRQSVTKEKYTAALSCWKNALALDPTSAALHGSLGYMHYMDVRFGWWDDRQTALEKARTYAARALELDPDSPDGHTASSLTLLLEGHYDEAAVHARRAAHLASGSADAVAFACVVLANAGNPQEAVAHGERAKILSPNYPASYLGQLGNAYRLATCSGERRKPRRV